MNQIDPAVIAMLLKSGLLKPKQPGLLNGVTGMPVVQGPNVAPVKKPIQSIGVRG